VSEVSCQWQPHWQPDLRGAAVFGSPRAFHQIGLFVISYAAGSGTRFS